MSRKSSLSSSFRFKNKKAIGRTRRNKDRDLRIDVHPMGEEVLVGDQRTQQAVAMIVAFANRLLVDLS